MFLCANTAYLLGFLAGFVHRRLRVSTITRWISENIMPAGRISHFNGNLSVTLLQFFYQPTGKFPKRLKPSRTDAHIAEQMGAPFIFRRITKTLPTCFTSNSYNIITQKHIKNNGDLCLHTCSHFKMIKQALWNDIFQVTTTLASHVH